MFASHRLHGALNREGRKEKSTESESVRDSGERGRRAGMKGAMDTTGAARVKVGAAMEEEIHKS